MSNPTHVSLLVLMLLLINLTTNPVNSEMRKSWSRKTTVNETAEKTEPLSTQDIMKYFQSNVENSDFESVFSDQSEIKDEVTETSEKVMMESETTTEVSSDDDTKDVEVKNEEVTETFSDDVVVNDENDREGKDESSDEKANVTQTERDIIRQGLNLIVLGE